MNQECRILVLRRREALFACGRLSSMPESGRSDSNRRRPAWEAGILPLNYARARIALQLYELPAWGQSVSIRLNTPRALLAPFGDVRIRSFLTALASLTLSARLGHRGTCGPCQRDGGMLLVSGQSQAYASDTDSNGSFDPFDLGVLLGQWGPCSHRAPAPPLAQPGPADSWRPPSKILLRSSNCDPEASLFRMVWWT